MPWDWKNAHEHKHGLSEAQARQWAEVANSVRRKCLTDGGTEADCDARAIRQANGVVGNTDTMNKLTCHKIQILHYEIRRTEYNGRPHIVVPAVLFVEGVHCGSAGPVLYTAEELAKFPAAWNGRPVPIFHPHDKDGVPISCNDPQTIQSRSVGNLFNVCFEDGKLKGEIWIDEERIKRISPTALSYIQTGRKLEVSTGIFSDEDPVSGEWNGEQYISIARNLRPDHLALLPGEQGACSWEDGCGIRSNQKEVINVKQDVSDKTVKSPEMPNESIPISTLNEGVESQKGLKALFTRVYAKLSSVFGELKAQEMSYNDVITKLQVSLDSMDSPTAINYIKAVYDDYFIYEVRPGEQATGVERKLYKRKYTIKDNGEIEMDNELVPVIQQIDYVELSDHSDDVDVNNEKEGEDKMSEEKTGCPEKVTQLIENESTKFDETDREWLETLNESQIDKLIPEKVEAKEDKPTTNDKEDTSVVNSKEDKSGNEKIPPLATFESILDSADPKVKEQLLYGARSYEKDRTALIEMIANQEGSKFSKEALETTSIEMLEKMASLITPTVNYQGNVGGITPEVTTHSNVVKPMSALGFTFNKKEDKKE